MPRINEQALKKELAKRGFESISIKRELSGGRVEVEANKLYPVHVEGNESIYAPIPVSLSVELDARGRVKSIEAILRIRPRSQMPRATSRRCATVGSWLSVANDSQLPGLRTGSSATNKGGKCCGANDFRLAKDIAGQSISRSRLALLAQASTHDGWRRDRDKRAGQGLGVHGALVTQRDTIIEAAGVSPACDVRFGIR